MTVDITAQIAAVKRRITYLAPKRHAEDPRYIQHQELSALRAALATLEACQRWVDYMESEGGEEVDLYRAFTGLPDYCPDAPEGPPAAQHRGEHAR